MSTDAIRNSTEYNPNEASTIPVSISNMSKEQFYAEMQLGLDDIKAGRVIPVNEVEAEMRNMYGT